MSGALQKKNLDNSIGISRNRTDVFNEYKENALARKNGRFAKSKKKFTGERLKDDSGSFEKSEVTTVELSRPADHAPYVNLYDDTVSTLDKFDLMLRNIQSLSRERIAETFGNHSVKDKKIEKAFDEAMSLIKKAEGSIGNFEKYEGTIDTQTESIFFRNMLNSLRIKVQSAAKELRKEQKRHYQRLSDFAAHDESHDFFGKDDGKMPDYLADEPSTAQSTQGGVSTMAQHDDQTEDIKRVVESIKTLTNLMSKMNDVVIEQGTIVDRIDYNIETAAKHVKKGNKELKEAKDTAENGLGAKCIRCLLMTNGVLFGILVLLFLIKH